MALTRFIPAGAGNTPSTAKPSACNPVHPRWRGEHHVFKNSASTVDGSSPLARGTRT